MTDLAFFFLGPPIIKRNGEPVQIRRRKALALAAYLVVTGRAHGRDTLSTLFWPELDQARARAGLRRELSVLRGALGDEWLEAGRQPVGLTPGAEVWSDVAQFREHTAAGQPHDHRAFRAHDHPAGQDCPACLPSLVEAAALYRDDFLAGFTLSDAAGFDDWQFFQTEGLRDELAGVLQRLARIHAGEGEFGRATAAARRWVALDPLHEPAHLQLMQIYARSGRRTAALRQGQECRRILQSELGAEPGPEIEQAQQAIQASEYLPAAAPSATPRPARRKHNLPPQPAPFVGRLEMLAQLDAYLRDPACRLLTLIGPGGAGKTRLALEAAAGQIDAFDGVFFVALAPLRSAEAILPAIAAQVGLVSPQEQDVQAQLLATLRHRRVLLVLDNFEHLSSGAGLLAGILEEAPSTRILATSRARLSIQGEQLFPVDGMAFPTSLPGPGPASGRDLDRDMAPYSAVQLFLASAWRVLPGFALTQANLGDVVAICRLVDGLPLGILLAAAWVAVLSPGEIAAEIRQGLGFLETDLRDLPERHRSLGAVFRHSWDLLAPHEQEVLEALSVFQGGFDRPAAGRVAGASLRDLKQLVDSSLLQRNADGRYDMHPLLQRYAAGRLRQAGGIPEDVEPDEATDAAREAGERHCAYYIAALERWAADLHGPQEAEALAALLADTSNARAAWDWAIDRRQVGRLEGALAGICTCYFRQGRFQEGQDLCAAAAGLLAAMSSAGKDPSAPLQPRSLAHAHVSARLDRLRVKVLAWQAGFCRLLEQTQRAETLLRQSLDLLEGAELAVHDTRAERALVLRQAGALAGDADRKRALQYHQESLALYRDLDDLPGAADVLIHLGWLYRYTGAYERGRRAFVESLTIWQGQGSRMGLSEAYWGLCGIALRQGRMDEAEQLVRQSQAAYPDEGDPLGSALRRHHLGETLVDVGKLAEGRAILKECLSLFQESGVAAGIAFSKVTLGRASLHLGYYPQAQAMGEEGLRLWRELDLHRNSPMTHLVLGNVALAEGAYAEAGELLGEGLRLMRQVEPFSEMAWLLGSLSLAARGLGHVREAQQHLIEGLRSATEIRSALALIDLLPPASLLLAGAGQMERAVELYALASRFKRVANSQWFRDVAGAEIDRLAETLPPDVAAAARQRGQAQDLAATAQALLQELAAGTAAP